MKQITKLISVSKITCTIPAEAYKDENLLALANAMIEAKGNIRPIVVKQTGNVMNPAYKLLDGAGIYHAMVAAKQLDPLLGETVLAVVVEEGAEGDAMLMQLGLI